ncbi:MAG: hypothetical protein AAF993_10940 [Pseudomonadota bacterium]
MNEVMLTTAGVLGMLIALVHGYLGETQVVRHAQAATESGQRVLHAIMFLSAVYWFVGGLVLALAPAYLDAGTTSVVAYTVAAIFAGGALGNLWATRGKHFGWLLLAAATGLAVAGA